MKRPIITIYSSCLLWIVPLVAIAQPRDNDSLRVRQVQAASSAIGQLKQVLRQNSYSGSAPLFDSLLVVSRQLGYQAGEVVVLCQLAKISFQQEQPNQAERLLQEAQRVSGQLQDMRDIGWTIGSIERIRGKSTTYSVAFLPLIESLTIQMSANIKSENLNMDHYIAEQVATKSKRGPSRRSYPYIPTISPVYTSKSLINSLLPIPPSNKNWQPPALPTDFVDKWLDSTLNLGHRSIVQQLKSRKKNRDESQELSAAFARQGNYAQAYRYFLQYTAYKDSLAAEITSRKLSQLTYNQAIQKKETQIELLKKDQQLQSQESKRQQQFVIGLVSCLALFALLSLLLIRNNRQKHTANRQLREQAQTLQQTLHELKATQTQLIHAEKMASLGELTAGIAHEIQNPLNFVTNFSEVSVELISELAEEQQQPARDTELEKDLLADLKLNLQKINQHGNRASSIVKGMLEHARTSSGEKEPTDLNALADEYLRLAYNGFRRSGGLAKDNDGSTDTTPADRIRFNVELITDFTPNLGKITIAPQDMGRVLLNLYNNAFYAVCKKSIANPDGYIPQISVSTTLKEGKVELRIKDNGTGIPSEIIHKIYQPFFTTKPTGEGTGLGLSLSYDIVTKGHSGSMQVRTEVGHFTEMEITLPT